MTIKDVRDILLSKEIRLQNIQRKLQLLQEEERQLEGDEELLSAATLSASRMREGLSDSNYRGDNGDVLLKYYKEKKERRGEIKAQMWKLYEEETKIRRIWCCFQMIKDPYYGILDDLYIKKELYRTAEEDYEYSHRVFEENRKKGLQQILRLYESNYDNMELIETMSVSASPLL